MRAHFPSQLLTICHLSYIMDIDPNKGIPQIHIFVCTNANHSNITALNNPIGINKNGLLL